MLGGLLVLVGSLTLPPVLFPEPELFAAKVLVGEGGPTSELFAAKL